MATTAIPTNTDINALFAFAQAAGVKVIYSLRLLNGSTNTDATLARYLWSNYRSHSTLSPSVTSRTGTPTISQTPASSTTPATWRSGGVSPQRSPTRRPAQPHNGPDTGGNLVTGPPDNGPGPTWTTSFAQAEAGSGLIEFVTGTIMSAKGPAAKPGSRA